MTAFTLQLNSFYHTLSWHQTILQHSKKAEEYLLLVRCYLKYWSSKLRTGDTENLTQSADEGTQIGRI